MRTLQYAYERLTQLGLSPYYQSKAKVYKDGKIIYSPYAVFVYCPQKLLSKYLKLLEDNLPHFKLVYFSEFSQLMIKPIDEKFQVVANTIESCETVEHVISAARLIENNYPENGVLLCALVKKFGSL